MALASLWQETFAARTYAPLDRDLDVDVAVIGGGIAGVTAARLLRASGLTVALLEARRLGGGDTGNTTAHLTELLDEGYAALESRFGREGARLAARSQRAAIEHIAGEVAHVGIDCGLRRVPAYRYAEREEDVAELEDELAAMRRAGLQASLVHAVPLPWPIRAAIRVEDQAQLHPLAYLHGLAARLVAGGGQVFEETRATKITEGEPCAVEAGGRVVTCRDVVVMTHAPVSSRFALHSKMAPYRTYAVSARVPTPPPAALYYDSDDPYHYTRLQEATGGRFLVVGGEDHKAGHDEPAAGHLEALEEYVRGHFAGAEIVHRWSGQVWEPADGLAFIGRSAGADHVWVGTGFSGTGLTFGTLAATVVTHGILGVPDPFARLYDATRVKPLAQARRYLAENADVAVRLARDRVDRGEVDGVGDVAPGEGRLVRVGGRMAAVHRAEDGHVTACAAACTHLGCYVRWNDAAACWDCPCHGSRFAPDGAVLSGPAVKALAPIAIPEGDQPAGG